MTDYKGAVAAVINYDGRVLIGRKREDSKKKLSGQLHILGGNVEEGETDEEAIIREVKEESGLEVKVGKYLGSGKTPTTGREIRWYECFSDTDEVCPASDVDYLMWVSKEQACLFLPKEILYYSRIH